MQTRKTSSATAGPSALPAPSPTAPTSPRRWTLTDTDGRTLTGHLPPWAGDDPSEHNVPPDAWEDRLADIHLTRRFPGRTVPVYCATSPAPGPVAEEAFSCTLDCNPHAEGPEPRVPLVNMHLCGDSWFTDLGPEDLTRLAATFRWVANRLDREVRPALVDAQEDWAGHTRSDVKDVAPGTRRIT
ncbi:DUF6907 domain-containing protein [Streptomyces sp. NBC_00448]|uniref:DUF6907 domain-containing protein n=1 Tax=Streptomyces sp. NBC_00448 TaxID=2903652 RepID=UPI002E1CA950